MVNFSSRRRWYGHIELGGWGGVLAYKMGMYVPPKVKKKGVYRAGQTYKVGAFRADRTLKVVTLNLIKLENQRTNGPVNAHLRSAAYTNKHV